MEVDLTDKSDCTPSSSENRLVKTPVSSGASGAGLPYAPEDWPLPGDVWRWKVGNRKTLSGYFHDRYLYPPPRIQKLKGKNSGFASKISVSEFIKKEFPKTDVDAFFASFIWNVPSAYDTPNKAVKENAHSGLSKEVSNIKQQSSSGLKLSAEDCKVGNQMCTLQKKAGNFAAIKKCDICCSEDDFCCDCCCILCYKPIALAYGSYDSIICEAILHEKRICGHAAHIECALRCYLAGTVGGSICLDVEYYCRHCDSKTDLIPRMRKLLKFCENLDSRDDVEKLLNLAICILSSSEQERAINLRNCIRLIINKLEDGSDQNDIWKANGNTTSATSDDSDGGNEATLLGAANIFIAKTTASPVMQVNQSEETDREPDQISSDHASASLKLHDEIDNALLELKRSQETEYRTAEQNLYTHKDFLLSLYQQLDVGKSELAAVSAPENIDTSGDPLSTSSVMQRIIFEEEKLKDMMKVAQGFGRTPRRVVSKHFGLLMDDHPK